DADVVDRRRAEVVDAVAHRGGGERAGVGRGRRRAGVRPRAGRGDAVLVLDRRKAAAGVGGGRGQRDRAREVRGERGHRRGRRDVVEPAVRDDRRGAGVAGDVGRGGAQVVEAVGERRRVPRAGDDRGRRGADGGPAAAAGRAILQRRARYAG